jgi:carboxypeptidase T
MTIRSQYTIQGLEGRNLTVHSSRVEEAAHIDQNQDGILQRDEMMGHLEHCNDGCHHHAEEKSDPEALMEELSFHLTRTPNPAASGYHSYEQIGQELADLEAAFPDRCKRVSLGKTHQGRDIWALQISKDIHSSEVEQRPGVVITGCHHAREWMSVEVPLHVANRLVRDYDSDPAIAGRVDQADIWIVPCLNADGYEKSRTMDPWWRKNCRPVEFDAMGKPTTAVGVDLNRNYDDGKTEHAHLYRPVGDTPGSTADDHGATSDNPNKDTYRGPRGASEIETQAILGLELGRPNMAGVIDHHSYGEMILYPWGYTTEEAPQAALYKEIGAKLNAAMDNRYELQQSSGLYPSSGESDDFHNANGLISFTLEVGRSFHPRPSTIPATCELVGKANMAFIDDIIERHHNGTLLKKAVAS